MLRYIPNQALNFSFNDLFKEYLRQNGNVTPVVCFAAGALAGACATITMYPLKFCQTRLSMDMGSGNVLIKFQDELTFFAQLEKEQQ